MTTSASTSSARSFLSRSLQQGFASVLLVILGLPAGAEAPTASTGTAAWSNVQRLLQSFQIDRQVKVGRSGNVNLIAASDLIDYRQIAQRSVGKDQWQTLTAAQREDLTSTIESLVQTRYYPRWRKIFGKGEVTFVSETKKGADTIVTTNLTLGHKCEPLLWQLCGTNPKIVSLAVDKNDLLTRLKERIQAHQAKGGYAEMISWLKGKGKTDGGAGGGDAVGVADAPLKTSARTIDLID